MRKNTGGSKHPDISVSLFLNYRQVEAITFLLNAVEELTL